MLALYLHARFWVRTENGRFRYNLILRPPGKLLFILKSVLRIYANGIMNYDQTVITFGVVRVW